MGSMSEQQKWFTEYDRKVSIKVVLTDRKGNKLDNQDGSQSDISPPIPVNIPPHSYHWLVSGEWHKQ